jgi:indole-3-glycerol phosphate synthase
LAVDLSTTEELAPHVPSDRDIVCESGLKTHDDLLRMEQCGARRFLVGEHLMRQDDIEAATRTLLGTSNAVRQSA